MYMSTELVTGLRTVGESLASESSIRDAELLQT